jgi:hypothetical protein
VEERAVVRTAGTNGTSRNAMNLHVPATQLYAFFLPVRRKRKMSLATPTDVFPLFLKQKSNGSELR